MAQRIHSHSHHEPPSVVPAESERHFNTLAASLRHLPLGDLAPEALANFPNFLILGPQRTGTTWLYHNLKKHPQVFIPRKKETFFFTTLDRPEHPHHAYDTLEAFLDGPMREPSRYRLKRHYDCLRKYREPYRPLVRGEATATNALLPVPVIREIVRLKPNLKAILMLRNPIERAWSHACKDLIRNTGRRPSEVSPAEFERFFQTAGQRALADYASQIRHWRACLRPGHLFVGEFEKIATAPEHLLLQIQGFLGIRTGQKYFNRHLRERINASETGSARRQSAVPPLFEAHLTSLLAEEVKQYRRIRKTLDPSQHHRAVRNRFLRPTAEKSRKKFHSAA